MTRMAWGGVLLWLVVVVAGSGVAWIAIDEAGRGVGSSQPALTATALPTASATATSGSSPTRRPTPSPSSRSSAPSSVPSKVPTSTGVTERLRTWSGVPGSVTVACRASVARLQSATPADGWRVEREDSGPGVRVKFESGENAVVVDGTCSGGTPRFRVSADD